MILLENSRDFQGAFTTKAISNAYPFLYPQKPESKIAPLNGKEREIERIQIDDPSALDPEILKRATLRNDADKNHFRWVLIAAVVTTVALVISMVSMFFAPVWVYPVAIISTVLLMSMLFEKAYMHQSEAKQYAEEKQQLQSCKLALESEEFSNFAKQFGDGKTARVNELLQAHRLFQNSRSLAQDMRSLDYQSRH